MRLAILTLILLVVLTACATEPQHIVYTMDMSEDPAPYREQCESQGGVFNECGSSCPPEAELCAAVCAYTCDIE